MAGLLVALILRISAAYIVDTWGIRKGIGLGAIIVSAFGFARGFSGYNFTFLFITTTGFSLCQAFVFNSMTIFSAKWFPLKQMIAPRGFTSFDAGVFGALISFGGIWGCFLIPAYSDKHRIKKPAIIYTTAALILSLVRATFCNLYPLLMASGFLLGFF